VIPKTHDQWTVFAVIMALIAVGLTDTLHRHRVFWRSYLTGMRVYWLTPVGAHRVTDLPRPDSSAWLTGQGDPEARPSGAGQPEWTEDDDVTLEVFAGIRRELADETPARAQAAEQSGSALGTGHEPDTAELDYDAEPPPGAPVLVPVRGSYLPVTWEPAVDDTSFDMLPYQPHAGPAAWAPARPSPRVRVEAGWTFIGGEWIHIGPAAATWIDQLFTQPIRQLEAASA
jgi:hypothetical protein